MMFYSAHSKTEFQPELQTRASAQPRHNPWAWGERSLAWAMLLTLGFGWATSPAVLAQTRSPGSASVKAAAAPANSSATTMKTQAVERQALDARAIALAAIDATVARLTTGEARLNKEMQPTPAPPAYAPLAYEALKLAVVDAIPLPRATGPRLDDGVHFYGEATQRDQIGSTYMIFEVDAGKAIGAVYWPQSSFSCFEGRFRGKTLALRVDDPYGEESYSHELALQETAIVAAGEELDSVELAVGIAGMHALDSANVDDRSLLAVCKAEL